MKTDVDRELQIERELARERAKSGLLSFITYTKPDFELSWHHKTMCRYMNDFVADKFDRLIITAPPRHTKALALGTPIPTPSGWTTMGQLAVGDTVFDETGRPTRVIAKSEVFKNRTCYRVTTRCGESVIAEENHLWRVRLCRKQKAVSNRTTRYLAQRESPRNPLVVAQGALDLPHRDDLPIDPYVLGAWLGDGCSGHATMTQGDADLNWMRARFEEKGYRTVDRSTRNTFGIVGGLWRSLQDNGLVRNKHVPAPYLRASRDQRLALLQGMMDTDGGVSQKGQCVFTSTKQCLSDALKELLSSLGVKSHLHERRAVLNGRDCGPIWQVDFYYADAFLLPRKAARAKNGTRTPGRYLQFEPAPPSDVVCIQVEAASGMFLCGRTMLPTHNSEIISRRLPAYILGRNPDAQIISASYGAKLAQRMNRDVQRIITTAEYRELFPETALNEKNIRTVADGSWLRNSEMFEVVGHKGYYLCAGIGGSLVGSGADCIATGAMVSTPAGLVAVEDVRPGDQVWSWNRATQRVESRPVQAVRATRSSRMVQVKFSSGRKIVCTADHLIFTQAGKYVPAGLLRAGESVAVIEEEEGELRRVPGSHPKLLAAMPSLLRQGSPRSVRSALLRVRRFVQQAAMRVRKEAAQGAPRRLLQRGLLGGAPCNQEQAQVPCMRQPGTQKDAEVLRHRVQATAQASSDKAMRSVRRAIQDRRRSNTENLLQEVRRPPALPQDSGRAQWAFRPWERVPGRLLCGAPPDSGAGQGLPGMRGAGNPRASHRPRQAQQFAGQLGSNVQWVPHHAPQIGSDTVSSVVELRSKEHGVHDIQVEGNSNFFAGAVLVHNCALIDDPVKSWKEAYSPTFRQNVWEWYTSVLYTRLSKAGRICLTLTRWHEDDLAGRLLELMKSDPESDRWVHINLPAIKEEPPSEDDPREIGEALWPDRYPLKKLEKIRRNSEAVFTANYQNRPAPVDGNVVKRQWWRFYTALPENVDLWAVSMDGTFKDKEKSDFCVIQVWARAGANKYLVHQVRARMPYVGQRQALRDLRRMFPQVTAWWLEDSALSSALKSDLGGEIPGLILVPAQGSKMMRADGVSPQIEAGNVYLPANKPLGQGAPEPLGWVEQYITEWALFPNGANDDQVDATSMALARLDQAMSWDWLPQGVAKDSAWTGI